jgi:PHD/YefM family antitoxin component YafN of YafNO toxin-antitoxin module
LILAANQTAEEVRETNNPRVLKRNNEPVAAVVLLQMYEQWQKDREAFFAEMEAF